MTERIDSKLKESYREKVEKFNKNLESLCEHFDLPKVGPGWYIYILKIL